MAGIKAQFAFVSVFGIALALLGSAPVEAGPHARGSARASVNRVPPPHAPRAHRLNAGGNSQPRATHANAGNRVHGVNQVNSGHHNRAGNRARINGGHNNINIDNHRDVDIDVDGHGRYGYDDHYHPIATAAAVTATVAVTAAVVGAIVRPAQLPSNCLQVVQGNVAYLQCGTVWYQPQYQGSDVTYVVVNAP